jgi:hypothetical protein
MKLKYASCFFMFIGLVGCSVVDKPEDVTFDVTVPLTFSISDPSINPAGKSYSGVETLETLNNPDVAKFASKLKGYRIHKITYILSNASPGTESLLSPALKISATDNTFASLSSISLSNTVETELNLNSAGIDDLTSRLLADNQEIVLLQGTLSKTPVAFTISFKFYFTLRVDANK